MDEALVVGRLKGVAELLVDEEDMPRGELSCPGEEVIEGETVEELHDQVGAAVIELADREDVDDVVVADLVDGACLKDKT